MVSADKDVAPRSTRGLPARYRRMLLLLVLFNLLWLALHDLTG